MFNASMIEMKALKMMTDTIFMAKLNHGDGTTFLLLFSNDYEKKKQVQCSCRCCQTCDNSTVNVSLLCSCLLCKFKLNELRHFLTSFGHQKITSSLRQKIRVAWKNAATGIKWLSKSRISSRTAMNYTYRGLKSLIFFK